MGVLVAHKYMPDEMPIEELRATFSAREHTLDYLIKSLREQIHAKTLTSFVITGPRGSGKTTLVRMVCLRLAEDPELNAAWMPVRFPEELPAITSLRDLLAAALKVLAEDGIPLAMEWHGKVEREPDDHQSQELAIAALRQITERQQKRIILFVENLNLVFERGLDKIAQGTLRRLLMTDPFMMMLATAVSVFGALEGYDEALFNYFCPVPLEKLNDEQVRQLLFRRADHDGNEQFKLDYHRHLPEIQVVSRLTGSNPRLILMLYEVLSGRDVGSIVQALRGLVDELTPLLKDILESLPAQQSKVLDALMQAGGTATPSDLAKATRLSLNIVTRQLARLKQAQMVEIRGGGKGRPAHYTVPDQLFCTWYQMRYLRPQRRRIEMFVEVLRVWFAAEERMESLKGLSSEAIASHGSALTAEYYAASLAGTVHEEMAQEMAVGNWLRTGEWKEAALALAEFKDLEAEDRRRYEALAYGRLGSWSLAHGDSQTAVKALEAAVNAQPEDMALQAQYGLALRLSGDDQRALACLDRIVGSGNTDVNTRAEAFFDRGAVRSKLGDRKGGIEDYTAVIEMGEVPKDLSRLALYFRAIDKLLLGDRMGARDDLTEVVKMEGISEEDVADARISRSMLSLKLGQVTDAFDDWLSVAKNQQASPRRRVLCARLAFHVGWLVENVEGAELALGCLAEALGQLDPPKRVEGILESLRHLAAPGMQAGWLQAWRRLVDGQPPEVIDQLRFLEPVAQVLKGGDLSVLDPLPPEQREFALEVLRKFEPERSGEPAGPSQDPNPPAG